MPASETAKSPFSPGAGKEPPAFVGRKEALDTFDEMLDDLHGNSRNLTVRGLRGVGKTVVMRHFVQHAQGAGVVAVKRELIGTITKQDQFELTMLTDAEKALRELSVAHRVGQRLGEAVMRALASVQASVQLALDPTASVSVGIHPDIASKTAPFEDRLTALFMKMGEIAKRTGRGVVFMYDEGQLMRVRKSPQESTLAQLLHAISQVQAENLPVGLVLVGLPPLAGIIKAAKSNSERLALDDVEIKNLKPEDAIAALEKPAADSGLPFQRGLAAQVAADCDYYPYFLQMYGDQAWRTAKLAGANRITPRHYRESRALTQERLDRTFYEARFSDRSQGLERAVLTAIGEGGNEGAQTQEVIAKLLAKGVVTDRAVVDNAIGKLVEDDVVYREGYGEIRFTAPGFGKFLDRAHPFEREVETVLKTRRLRTRPALKAFGR